MEHKTEYLDDKGGVDLSSCSPDNLEWVKAALVSIYKSRKLSLEGSFNLVESLFV